MSNLPLGIQQRSGKGHGTLSRGADRSARLDCLNCREHWISILSSSCNRANMYHLASRGKMYTAQFTTNKHGMLKYHRPASRSHSYTVDTSPGSWRTSRPAPTKSTEESHHRPCQRCRFPIPVEASKCKSNLSATVFTCRRIGCEKQNYSEDAFHQLQSRAYVLALGIHHPNSRFFMGEAL